MIKYVRRNEGKMNRRDLFSEKFVFRRFVRFSDDDSYKVFR